METRPATADTGRKCWMLVGSVGNWHRTKELGFTIQAIKARHRKKVTQMRPGDGFAYYCTGVMAFAGTTTVTSEYFESIEPSWISGDPERNAREYPFRVRIAADLALDDDEFVDAEPLARQMAYARKWPPEHWTLAFQGNVHLIPEEDFQLIRTAIERAASQTNRCRPGAIPAKPVGEGSRAASPFPAKTPCSRMPCR